MSENKYFEVVWEDDYLLVVDKSAGILSVPAPRRKEKVLTDLVNEYLSSKGERAYPAHRLDLTTSGLLVLAKSIPAQRSIMKQFYQKKVFKKYIAFVNGKISRRRGLLKGFIKKTPHTPAKLALTKYRLVRSFGNMSIVDIEPLSGRYNQIRIHFAQIGHPLLGERKYAQAKYYLKFSRPALHSYLLRFRHPVGKSLIEVKIDLASDMKEFLKKEHKIKSFVI